MTYGERLQQAITRREDMTGQKIGRIDLAKVADCSRQNIGMILTHAKGGDQKLSTASHAAVAAYLKVNPEWLLTGRGSMVPPELLNAPSHLTAAAVEIGVLFDLIPEQDRPRRAQAYNGATTAIMKVLQDAHAKAQAAPDSGKRGA